MSQLTTYLVLWNRKGKKGQPSLYPIAVLPREVPVMELGLPLFAYNR